MIAYPACMIKLGFVVSTLAFVFVSVIFLGIRGRNRWLSAAGVSVISTAAVFLVLVKVFNVFLPHGLFY